MIVVSDYWLPVDSTDDAGNPLARGSAAHVADIERRMGPLVEKLTATGALVVFMRFLRESQRARMLRIRRLAGDRTVYARQDDPLYAPYNEMLDRVARRYPDRVRLIDLSDLAVPRQSMPGRSTGSSCDPTRCTSRPRRALARAAPGAEAPGGWRPLGL